MTEWLENGTIQSLLKEHLDETGYRICKALNGDGRMSDTEFGERAELSRTAAHRRRKKLEEERTIDVLGIPVLQEADFVYADVFVKLGSEATVGEFDEFLETVKGDGFIYEVEGYMGTYDLLLCVWHATLGDIQSYLRAQLQCHDLVAKYETMPVTRTHEAWHKPITDQHDMATSEATDCGVDKPRRLVNVVHAVVFHVDWNDRDHSRIDTTLAIGRDEFYFSVENDRDLVALVGCPSLSRDALSRISDVRTRL